MHHPLPDRDHPFRSEAVADALLRVCVLSCDRLDQMQRATSRCLHRRRAVSTARARTDRDRGDVPGWVLVTLMTAGLVTVLWVLARDRLTTVFDRAISSVAGQ
ncbi:MAG TPA: hypothetical protein VHN80_31445 [Kineosporiaceae bacterium]|nr:hypothetical protein [Kineosporiaceae bacterium]